MYNTLKPMTRIGIFYDGQYFLNVSNYYSYQHERMSRICIEGLHALICQQVSLACDVDLRLCQIVEAHYFRGRLSARDAENRQKLYHERSFDDVLMGANVTAHHLPLRRNGTGGHQEKGVDVWLALEALERAMYKRFDVLVLIASDGDYLPLVRKVTALGIRVLLVCWEFEFTDENGIPQCTRVSQQLMREVSHPILVHQLIDDPNNRYSPMIHNLFLSPSPAESDGVPAWQDEPPYDQEEGVEPEYEEEVEIHESAIARLLKGYGFIKFPPNNVFFHYTSLVNVDFDQLEEGMMVRFTLHVKPNGVVQAGRVWLCEGAEEGIDEFV